MKQPPEVLKAFMQDFWQQTLPHPNVKCISLFSKDGQPVVQFEVYQRDGYIELEYILSLQEGFGSCALDWFCALADKHGVEIRGTIYPTAGGKLDRSQLAEWYKRRGFIVDEQFHIYREPKTTAPSPAAPPKD